MERGPSRGTEAPAAFQATLPAATSTEGSMNVISSLACLALLSAPADTVLLQFSTKSCPHCQAMQPVVARLAQQGVNVQVLDAEQRTDLRSQFRVNGVPTFVAVTGGQEIGRIEGLTSYEKLAALVGSRESIRDPPS